ncbi:MAG: NADH-quinone oxidoreductase subunit NuoE [Bacillota bacterium]
MSILMIQRKGGVPAVPIPDSLPAGKLADLERFLTEHRGKANMVIPALQHAQALFDYVPQVAIVRIAEALRVPQAKVYGVATFYAQFRLQPAGRHTVKVCTGTACHVRGAETVLKAWSELLGIRPGETTGDGAITLERVACLGACGLAPAAMVDARTHGRLTPAKVKQVLATIPR